MNTFEKLRLSIEQDITEKTNICINHSIDAFVYSLISEHHARTEKALEESIRNVAFPKIIGKITKFSLWWRFLKPEIINKEKYVSQIIIRRFGKIILERKVIGFNS